MKIDPMKLLLLFLVIMVHCCDGVNTSADCTEFCQKEIVECCQELQGPPDCVPEQTVDECANECEIDKRVYKEEVFEGINDCIKKPCDDVDGCIGEVLASCSGDVSGASTKICEKQKECDSSVNLEECSSIFSLLLDCMKQNSVDTIVSCAEDAACATFEDDLSQCMDDNLGLSFGD